MTILAIYSALGAGVVLGAGGALLWVRGKLADIQRGATRIKQLEAAYTAGFADLRSERDQLRHEIAMFDERDRQHEQRVAEADARDARLTNVGLEVLAEMVALEEARRVPTVPASANDYAAPLYAELGGPNLPAWQDTFTSMWAQVEVPAEEEPALPEPTPVDVVDQYAAEAFAVLDVSGWNKLDGPELTAAIVAEPVKGAQHRLEKPAKRRRGRKKHAHGGVR